MKHPYNQERKTIRLQSWEYSWNATYHVTIITKKRTRWFGSITAGVMHLNALGAFAHNQSATLSERHEGLVVHEFVVMPDHVHLLITLPFKVGTGGPARNANRFGPQPGGSLATVVNAWKGAITKCARQMDPDFGWQSRYYDHIIRDDANFANIIRYIRNNPARWRG